MNKAVFVDRDGTIIAEKGYLADPAGVEILLYALEGIKFLKEAGFKIIVITNQSGVGRGYFTLKELKRVNNYVSKIFKENNAKIDGFYFCPHTPKDNCGCRKPKPGMIKRAQKDFDIDLKKSYVIGDSLKDIQLGQSNEMPAILIMTGYGEKTKKLIKPDFIAKNLFEAANWILRKSKSKKK